MMEQFFTVNVIGTAALVGYLVGLFWYSPVLSSRLYLISEGLCAENAPKRSKSYLTKVMAYSFMLHIMLALTLSLMMSLLAPKSVVMALVFSSLFSVGIIVITRFIDLIYTASGTFNSVPNQKKFLFSSLYYITLFAIMTFVMYCLAIGTF